MGSGAPAGASRTMMTEAAGLGTATGVLGSVSATSYRLMSCATRSRWYVASPKVNSDDLARLK
jgi:hypothetical protein